MPNQEPSNIREGLLVCAVSEHARHTYRIEAEDDPLPSTSGRKRDADGIRPSVAVNPNKAKTHIKGRAALVADVQRDARHSGSLIVAAPLALVKRGKMAALPETAMRSHLQEPVSRPTWSAIRNVEELKAAPVLDCSVLEVVDLTKHHLGNGRLGSGKSKEKEKISAERTHQIEVYGRLLVLSALPAQLPAPDRRQFPFEPSNQKRASAVQ